MNWFKFDIVSELKNGIVEIDLLIFYASISKRDFNLFCFEGRLAPSPNTFSDVILFKAGVVLVNSIVKYAVYI
jgi:hypothetical protein